LESEGKGEGDSYRERSRKVFESVRVVFDTNIFISAFVIPGSLAEKAILKIIEEKDSLLISAPIIDEILSVLSSKFGRDREELSHVAVTLSELAELVKPAKGIRGQTCLLT
jgi:putative PIN family toxin of toxin-antitoxin system